MNLKNNKIQKKAQLLTLCARTQPFSFDVKQNLKSTWGKVFLQMQLGENKICMQKNKLIALSHKD